MSDLYAIIAKRDAEIAALRAQCDNLFNQLRAAEKFAAALAGDAAEWRAQVAELEAALAAGETERKELHDLAIELQDKIDFNRTGRIP